MDSSDLMHEVAALAADVVARARARKVFLATAESLTAGLISATIASVPGASEVLRGGAATYTEKIKHDVLGVSWDTLITCTAVSDPCACDMAVGARRVFEADIAVSATGYAGPGGGTDTEPVGTVYLGLATADGVEAERCSFSGDRNEVRLHAVRRALELMLDALA